MSDSDDIKGPWYVSDISHHEGGDPTKWVYDAEAKLVATVRQYPGFPSAGPRAALIASAPTLRDDLGRAVDALRRAVDVTEGVHDSWRCSYPERYRACTESDPQCETQQERKAWCSLLAKLEGGR